MSITANAGPLVSFGNSPGVIDNPEAGPSAFFAGPALLDPRGFWTYEPGQDFGSPTAAFSAMGDLLTLIDAPPALAAAAVAPAANVVANAPMALVSTSGNGVVIGQSIQNALTGAPVTGLVAIEKASARIQFGSAGTLNVWDPTSLLARAVSITGVAGGAGGAFLVRGYDVYWFPMTEQITATAGATTVNGKKAFKYIASVTPLFSDAHNYEVGTTDIIGLPLASVSFSDLLAYDLISATQTLITSSAGYLAGDTTLATATTGDVRGTLALGVASNAANVLSLRQTILPSNLALGNGVAGTNPGIFGVTQYSG